MTSVEMLLDTNFWAKIALFFNNSPFLFAFMIIGFCFVDKVKFTHVIALTFFMMSYNVLLKSIFLIPLNPELNKPGFSFPSGHTQASLACLGTALYLFKNNLFRIVTTGVLVASFFAMVHFRYHIWFDIAGGTVFTIIAQVIYFKALKRYGFQKISTILGVLVLSTLGCMIFAYYRTWVPSHMWTSLTALIICFFYSLFFLNTTHPSFEWHQKQKVE